MNMLVFLVALVYSVFLVIWFSRPIIVIAKQTRQTRRTRQTLSVPLCPTDQINQTNQTNKIDQTNRLHLQSLRSGDTLVYIHERVHMGHPEGDCQL